VVFRGQSATNDNEKILIPLVFKSAREHLQGPTKHFWAGNTWVGHSWRGNLWGAWLRIGPPRRRQPTFWLLPRSQGLLFGNAFSRSSCFA